LKMTETERKAVDAAVAELVAALPVVGPALKAVLTFFDVRANELRLQQLEAWVSELMDRVESLGTEKLDRSWLAGEEGHRVVLALGEAALDLLREDKVRLLAGAAVSAAEAEVPWADSRREFARIIIEADLDVLATLAVFAHEFGTNEESWVLRTPAYAEELPQRSVGLDIAPELLASVNEHTVRDAVIALERFRLADRVDASASIPVAPSLTTIYPREAWREFAQFLLEAIGGGRSGV